MFCGVIEYKQGYKFLEQLNLQVYIHMLYTHVMFRPSDKTETYLTINNFDLKENVLGFFDQYLFENFISLRERKRNNLGRDLEVDTKGFSPAQREREWL